VARARFSVDRVVEALKALELATATDIASWVLERDASDDDRRMANKVLIAESARFVQEPDGRWKLASEPSAPVPSTSSKSTSAAEPAASAYAATDAPVAFGSAGDVRTALMNALRLDLVGPASAHEVISERPTAQYLLGALRPGYAPLDPDAAEQIEVQADDATEGSAASGRDDTTDPATQVQPEDEPSVDLALPSTEALNQSSIGLSFATTAGQRQLRCAVSYGTYAPTAAPEDLWQRTPQSAELLIDLDRPRSTTSLPNEAELVTISRNVPDGRAVTVFLVNRRVRPDGRPDDIECLFQPSIRITSPDETPAIVARPAVNSGADPDSESNRLLYRNLPEFAAGHGCAVDWDPPMAGGTRSVWTSLIPTYETPSVTPEVDEIGPIRMDDLAVDSTGPELVSRLRPILDAYNSWVTARELELGSLPADLDATGRIHLAACREALRRMEAGLRLLEVDTAAREAFRLANRAMASQRLHSLQARAFRRTGVRPTLSDFSPPHWRPFQLAFMLLNLIGIADRADAERQLVDLLWFPTGGGKTEAYLGLAAFTIFLRRLRASTAGARGHAGSGVAVLMRYTLRLLTVQQFQRATTLVCAMELLRRSNPRGLGRDPIAIGLWVGQKTSPNRYEEAKARLADLTAGRQIADANPMHIANCPWCGAQLSPADHSPIDEIDRVLVHCPNSACEFHGSGRDETTAIPATVIDEEIYARCPSMVIGTVDKFARLPWIASTMALFGRVDRFCPRHGFVPIGQDHSRHRATTGFGPVSPISIDALDPPDLIIQDELHLITGPLGTLTGIYESAIAFLGAAPDGHGRRIGPKIVASTATIRRADDQVRSLFARETRRFPPAGLDAGDSFFARQVPMDRAPGRLYVGIYAPGRSGKTVLVRVMALILQKASDFRLQAASGDRSYVDPYWTLVGYFNSLRELGGASRLIDDDIPARMSLIARRSLRALRTLVNPQELTSRVGPERVPEILMELEQDAESGRAVDTLLATNMIQVGVDIDRLGLMVVTGQPKTSAEYIQATSRVGRTAPGLVLTVLNWTRPRDISHYERFTAYHAGLYRHVEGASLTPMSARSRDRALPGVLVAMLRLGRDGWAGNQDAVRFTGADPLVSEARRFLVDRTRVLEPDEAADTEAEFQRLEDVWDRMADPALGLRYANPFHQQTTSKILLTSAEDTEAGSEGFRVLNSLRDVEAESELRLVTRSTP
jgi:hypothetical protein